MMMEIQEIEREVRGSLKHLLNQLWRKNEVGEGNDEEDSGDDTVSEASSSSTASNACRRNTDCNFFYSTIKKKQQSSDFKQENRHNYLNSRDVISQIFEEIGRVILYLDEQLKEKEIKVTSQPDLMIFVHRITQTCYSAIDHVAGVLDCGDDQIRYFLLNEVLPVLKSKVTRIFVLDCIPFCYRERNYEHSGNYFVGETDCNDDHDGELDNQSDGSDECEMQMIFEALQLILELDKSTCTKVLMILHDHDTRKSTRALVKQLTIEYLPGSQIKEVPSLAKILLEIDFVTGVKEVLDEIDAIITSSVARKSSTDVDYIRDGEEECIQTCLEYIYRLCPPQSYFSSKDKNGQTQKKNLRDLCFNGIERYHTADVYLLLTLSSKPFLDIYPLINGDKNELILILYTLMRTDPYNLFSRKFTLSSHLRESMGQILLWFATDGFDVVEALTYFCKKYRVHKTLSSILEIMHPVYLMSYEADSDSDTFLDRSPSKVKRQGVKKRKLVKEFKENAGKRLSLNCCFEYRLSRPHDNSAHQQKGEILDLLISLARVVSELRHIEKLTDLFLAWERLYRRRRKRIKLIKFLEVLASAVVLNSDRCKCLHNIVKQLFARGKRKLMAIEQINGPLDDEGIIIILQFVKLSKNAGQKRAASKLLFNARFITMFREEDHLDYIEISTQTLNANKSDRIYIDIRDIGHSENQELLTTFLQTVSHIFACDMCTFLRVEVDVRIQSNQQLLLNYLSILSRARSRDGIELFYDIFKRTKGDLAYHLYIDFENVSLLWKILSESFRSPSFDTDEAFLEQVLEHLNQSIRKSSRSLSISMSTLTELVEIDCFADILNGSERRLEIYNEQHKNDEPSLLEENILVLTFQLILNVAVILKFGCQNIDVFIDAFYEGKSINRTDEKLCLQMIIKRFEKHLCSLAFPSLVTVIIDILGTISFGDDMNSQMESISKAAMSRVYTRHKSSIQTANRDVLFLLMCFRRKPLNSKSFSRIEKVVSCTFYEHPWLSSLMVQQWAFSRDKLKTVASWVESLKKVVTRFGKKPVSGSDIPMLNFATFSTFYCTVCRLLPLSLDLNVFPCEDPFKTISRFLRIYVSCLELFAQNSVKFAKKYLQITLSLATTFIASVEPYIDRMVLWRKANSNNLSSLQNVANAIQATLHFLSLLREESLNMKDDYGILSEQCSGNIPIQNLRLNCYKCIQFLRVTCSKHNLKSCIDGCIEIDESIAECVPIMQSTNDVVNKEADEISLGTACEDFEIEGEW